MSAPQLSVTSAEASPRSSEAAPPATRLPEGDSWRGTAWVAASTQLLTQVGFGLAIPFMPLYVQELGVTERAEVALWTGMIAASAAATMAIMAPIWGALSDRFGLKLMLSRSMLAGALLLALMGFAADVQQLLGLRLLQGALTGSVAAAAALVAAASPPSQVGFALGLVNTAIQSGNAIGPAVGGIVLGVLGFRGSFLLAGLLLLAGGLLCVFGIREPSRGPTARSASGESRDTGHALRRTLGPFTWPALRGLLLHQVGTQSTISGTFAMLPLLVQDLARPAWLSVETATGLALALSAGAAVVVMPFFGPLVDRGTPGKVLAASSALLAVSFVLQALIPHLWLFLALRVVVGIGVAGVIASMGVLVKHASPVGREGAAYGAAGAAQSLGWALGPLLGSALAAIAGIPTLYLLCGFLMAVLAAGPAPWRRRTSRVSS